MKVKSHLAYLCEVLEVICQELSISFLECKTSSGLSSHPRVKEPHFGGMHWEQLIWGHWMLLKYSFASKNPCCMLGWNTLDLPSVEILFHSSCNDTWWDITENTAHRNAQFPFNFLQKKVHLYAKKSTELAGTSRGYCAAARRGFGSQLPIALRHGSPCEVLHAPCRDRTNGCLYIATGVMEDPSTPCWRIATLWIAACQCGRYCTSWLYIHWPGYEYYVYYVYYSDIVRIAVILSKQQGGVNCDENVQVKWAVYLSRFLFVTSDGQGALYYEGPALVLLQTEQGHVLGALSTQTLHVLVAMETGQPTEQHWSDWWYELWMYISSDYIYYIPFHNHAFSVVGDSQYSSHPWISK